MSRYETRVQVWFYSEGASPSVVVKKLLALGFQPIKGAYDFVYIHSEEEMSDADLGSAILEISDALHKTLNGFKVLYTLASLRTSQEALLENSARSCKTFFLLRTLCEKFSSAFPPL